MTPGRIMILMKRHPALIPISREHHQLLLLAQLLKKNAPAYRGLPDTREGKVHFARQTYQSLLSNHLLRDRQVLLNYLEKWVELSELSRNLMEQNQYLLSSFEELTADIPEEKLDEIGHHLEHYVRVKERQLFQQSQQLLTETDFTALEAKLKSF